MHLLSKSSIPNSKKLHSRTAHFQKPSASYLVVHRWMRWYCISHMYKWDPRFCVYFFFFFHVCLQFSSPMPPSLNHFSSTPRILWHSWALGNGCETASAFYLQQDGPFIGRSLPKGRHVGYPGLRWTPMTLYWHCYVCRPESLQIDGTSWVLEEVPVNHRDWFGIKEEGEYIMLFVGLHVSVLVLPPGSMKNLTVFFPGSD